MASKAAWIRAALAKDRTRRAIRDRLRAKESMRSIAADYDVPERFVRMLGQWQMFGDDNRRRR